MGIARSSDRTTAELALIVFDIDGVLADVRHRLQHLERRPKDWERFFAAAEDDAILEPGLDAAATAALTHEVVYLTGRPERVRAATVRWLRLHQLPEGDLYMRPDDDRRPARQFKVHTLQRLSRTRRIDLVIDDDPGVIAAISAAGFPTLLADWMPPVNTAPSKRPDDTLFGAELLQGSVLHDAQEHDGRT